MGRGNTIIRDSEGVGFPTFYVDYYEHDDSEESNCSGNPCYCNEPFVSDFLGNIRCSILPKIQNFEATYLQHRNGKAGTDYNPNPTFLHNNNGAIYFESNVLQIVMADNENSIAIGAIPIYNENGNYNKYIFKRAANNFFRRLIEMYNISKRTSAWTSSEITDKNYKFYD